MFTRCAALPFLLALSFVSVAHAGDVQPPPVDKPACRPTTDPSQGGDQAYPTCLRFADITLDVGDLPGMAIGGVFVPWGGNTVLQDANASARYGGRCAFSYLHLNLNTGDVASGATQNAIYLHAVGLPMLASSPLPSLQPGMGAVSSGTLWLAPGVWALYVYADASWSVAETNEQNNLRMVQVTVQGRCG
jgi:hypothetical protein